VDVSACLQAHNSGAGVYLALLLLMFLVSPSAVTDRTGRQPRTGSARLKKRIRSTVSHEFRTPVTAIASFPNCSTGAAWLKRKNAGSITA